MIIIDDFMPDAEASRRHALSANFVDWPGPDGETYKRVCVTEIPGFRDRIEHEMGPVEMLGMAYRLNYAGEMPNHAIHSDMGWGTHAAVLYLCDGYGGTAMWTHRATGAKRIDPGQVELFEAIRHDWNDTSRWRMNQICTHKFNRATIYESARFHSRWPLDAFGDSPETGRLVAVAFFTPKAA